MIPETSCCFTGHRPEKLPWGVQEDDPRALRFRAALLEQLQASFDAGYHCFLCGMARGADLIFCETALLLREVHPQVRVIAAIPFVAQSDRWPEPDQLRYRHLLSRCDYETVIQHDYTAGCFLRRNRYMVDHAGRLIAAYGGAGGGTLYTIQYAIAQQRDVVIMDV